MINLDFNIGDSVGEILKRTDVLVDGAYIDELRDISLPWAGSKNQRVIDIKNTLVESKVVLYK